MAEASFLTVPGSDEPTRPFAEVVDEARRALPLHLAPPRLLAWCWSDYRALARPGASPGDGDGADAGPGGAVGPADAR